MKIAIVGAGGMGSTYGGRLAAAGNEVWLVDVWADHVNRVREAGLIVDGPAGRIESRPRATTRLAEIGQVDLAMVFVKSQQTAAVAREVGALLGPRSQVLTLQNGYGNAETLQAAVGPERLLAGVSYRSAELRGPGYATEEGVHAETILGPFGGGDPSFAEKVVAAFNAAGLVARLTDQPRNEMWGKLLVNCAGNAVGAITDQSILRVVQNEPAMALVNSIIDEVVRLATRRGITLPYPDPYAHVRNGWSKLGPDARASTHQDVQKGRPTEIDALNGAIVRESEKEGFEAPYNRAITLLIKALELRNARRASGEQS
jgi:2-dehydropantoate 2-reductase